jgi:hypothetical protein
MSRRVTGILVRFVFQATALILAADYFCFQVEVFEEEYEKNNPLPCAAPTFTPPQENWESFDKTNAPQAFVVAVPDCSVLLCLCPAVIGEELPASQPFRVVRNNSPPPLSDTAS